MNLRIFTIFTLLFPLISCTNSATLSQQSSSFNTSDLSLEKSLLEEQFQQKGLAIRQKVASEDLVALDEWWQKIDLGDPHKYLLPVILSRLSLPEQYNTQTSWDILINLDEKKPSLYHFRSIYDIRIFFEFQETLPTTVAQSYQNMLTGSKASKWMAQGTENHMFMHRISGLALMNGSGFPNELPGVAATNEAWLRSEINKFLTIGQGEFNSSTYYSFSISGLLNLYDFAKTPELKQWAKAGLDWYALNIALRWSWGTLGGAESRGYDRGTWDGTRLSAIAWLWWGENQQTLETIPRKNAQTAVIASLSDYRPPEEFRALARKEIPLPFTLQASHPCYYSYHQDNCFWETFYVTPEYSLSTLLVPHRSYQKKGTINGQYATYKLVIRDPKEGNNGVINLGGTFHRLMATGASPGDQYLQSKGTVIYQLRLNEKDKLAEVPGRSHLILPRRYGQPLQHQNWYIWQLEDIWLLVRPWGEEIEFQETVSQKRQDHSSLVAKGEKTAWITEVVTVQDYPDLNQLKQALEQTQIDDSNWENLGELKYTNLEGDRLEMTYDPDGGIGRAKVNDKERRLDDWDVFESPYVNQKLYSGILEVRHPNSQWCLALTLTHPIWDCPAPSRH